MSSAFLQSFALFFAILRAFSFGKNKQIHASAEGTV
jgi:hypothetical protein